MPAKGRVRKAADANLDPLSGEKGAHPVGVGVGTAAGGAAAGAAAGMVAGPVGAVVGAVVGGLVGGLAGKEVAEAVEPTDEDTYWETHFRTRPYAVQGASYDLYRPAYLYGRDAMLKHEGKSFEEVQRALARGWRKARSGSSLTWEQAKPAVRDAWERTRELRAESLRVRKRPVRKGTSRARKSVVIEREELEVTVVRAKKPKGRGR
jgi:hypothetical protein